VVGHYESFFTASAGASAAILGLLVVALSVVNADDTDSTTRERRTVLAGSGFLALVDIFFVSIVALTGGSVVFGLSSLTMATVGLLATRRLISRSKRAGNFSRGFPTRKLNIVFASISAGGYSVQFGLAVALLADTQSAALQSALVLVIVIMYGSALGRAWEVAGITRRGEGACSLNDSVGAAYLVSELSRPVPVRAGFRRARSDGLAEDRREPSPFSPSQSARAPGSATGP
jgi:hypothetical protein